jgi:hypothetical protein
LQHHFDFSPFVQRDGANTAADNSLTAATKTDYFNIASSIGVAFLPSDLPVGMLINDIAVDPDTGDAYFTDSFNCREILFRFVCCH